MKGAFKKHRSQILAVFLVMVVALVIRSFHFADSVNFMQDQADDSYTALHAWQQKKPVLIGSYIAFTYAGRKLLQGPLIIYTFGLFQAGGGFDPLAASYLFTIVAVLMIIPLYMGVRLMFDQKTALAVSGIYAFLPYYINYTRFMWNPNFQLIFVPFLLVTMGLYKRSRKSRWICISGVICGLLLQYHFQFIPVTAFVMCWLLWQQRAQKKKERKLLQTIGLFAAGFGIGWFPYILFELRHQFYNTQTLVLFLRNFREVTSPISRQNAPNLTYYGLSISLVLLPFVMHWILKDKRYGHVVFIAIALCAYISYVSYAKPIDRPFLGVKGWFYRDEEKVHSIVHRARLPNAAVAHLVYDNTASVQKYLMLRDQTPGVVYNYRTNRYLFAVSDDDRFEKYSAYEIQEFVPRNLIKKWPINKHYSLYLFERTQSL